MVSPIFLSEFLFHLPSPHIYCEIIVIDMKKVIAAVFFVILVISLYGLRTTESKVDSLLLNNVEAIAAGEGGSTPVRCFGSGVVLCPINQKYVDFYVSGYSLEDFD